MTTKKVGGDEGGPGSGKIGTVKGVSRVVVHNARHLTQKARGRLAGGGR